MLKAHFGKYPSKGFGPIYFNGCSSDEGVEYVEVHFNLKAISVRDIYDKYPAG